MPKKRSVHWRKRRLVNSTLFTIRADRLKPGDFIQYEQATVRSTYRNGDGTITIATNKALMIAKPTRKFKVYHRRMR